MLPSSSLRMKFNNLCFILLTLSAKGTWKKLSTPSDLNIKGTAFVLLEKQASS